MNDVVGGIRIARRREHVQGRRHVANARALDEAETVIVESAESHRAPWAASEVKVARDYTAQAMNGPGQAAARINLSELLENSAVGPLQIRVFALCMICLIMDGFDVQAMGYVAPGRAPRLRRTAPGARPDLRGRQRRRPHRVAPLQHAGRQDRPPPGDHRRHALVLGPHARHRLRAEPRPAALAAVHLGLGLGCIIPNATALVGEFSPKRSRVTLTMGITVGFTAGAAVGGFVALWLIPLFGWRSVFFVGGAVPLVIAVAMYFSLPESLQFLAVRRTRLDQLARWLKKLDPSIRVGPSTEYVSNEKARSGVADAASVQRGAQHRHVVAVGRVLHEPAHPVLAVELDPDGVHGDGIQPERGAARRHPAAGGRDARRLRPGVGDRAQGVPARAGRDVLPRHDQRGAHRPAGPRASRPCRSSCSSPAGASSADSRA